MARKPGPLTPGGRKGGSPPRHHHRHHPLHRPGGGPMTPGGGPMTPGGGPMTPGGGGTGAPAHRPPARHRHPAHHPKANQHRKATHHRKAKHHPKRTLAGAPLGGAWILGGNDAAGNCALVAVANSLLAATGRRVDDGELLRIHDRAGPLSIPEALAALGAGFTELQPGGAIPWSYVAGLVTPHGPHAALLLGGDLVTWGGVLALPDDWDIEETWAVTW